MTFITRPVGGAKTMVVPGTVSTGATVDVSQLRDVTIQYTFGDFVGVVMPQASYDGTNFVDLLVGGVNASCGVPVYGRPKLVRSKTLTATSGSTQTAAVSGSGES